MASTGLDFSKLTPSNGAVSDLKQLIFLAVTDVEKLGQVFNFMPRQLNGKKVGFVGEFGPLGKKSQGCKPTWNKSVLAASEKTWEIDRWEIAEELCFEDLVGTLAQISLRTKTAVADLTGTEYLDYVLMPRLELAVRKLLMRLAWFGDKEAETVTEGGVIADDVDKDYFTVTNGFWKRIFEIVAEDASRRTAIAANAKTTFAEQKSALLTAGVPTDIFDAMIMDASPVLRQAEGQIIYVTQSMKDALDWDLVNNNKGSELQWTALFDGIQRTNYKGIEMLAIPFWDEIIRSYEGVTGGKSWNKPHRAIYTVKDNLLLGSESENELAELKTWFSDDDQVNRILARDTLGTMIAQDDLLQVAY